MLLIAAMIAALVTVSAPHSSEAAPARVEALLIGDSVLNGLAQSYSSAGRAALAARHSFILDAAGCRRLITTSCSIPPSPAPTNAITVLRARAGQYYRALVVAAGYDDPSSGSYGIGAAVDVMIAEARRQGVPYVIWLTYREAGSSSNVARFRASNAVLRSKAAQYPDLRLADWNSRSWTLPSSWFSADGIHLGGQSAAAMGDLIGDALDALGPVTPPPPPPPPPEPIRCTAGVWSGEQPASSPPSTGISAVGGLQVMSAPERLIDTRQLAGPLGPGKMLTLQVAGTHQVPAEAAAALVSVTAVEPCADTFLTVFPCGSGVPPTSTLNAVKRSTVANSALVRLGSGALCVYSLQPTDVIVDLAGWTEPNGLATTPVSPVRLIDTRPGSNGVLAVPKQRVAAGHELTVDMTGVAGYDPSVKAATLNVTAVAPAGPGYLSVLPGPCTSAAMPPPATSTVNVATAQNAAASATVGIVDGQICVYTFVDTDIVVDLQSLHYLPSAPTTPATGEITAIDPQRVLDTRKTTRLAAGVPLPVDLSALVGSPAMSAVIVNLTAVLPSASGFLTLYPCSESRPEVSNVNYVAGQIVANRATVATAGGLCLYSLAATDVVIDVEGWVPLPPS
ncbi:MAG: SGNH/GDSL hydrolase family protein [Ilumatobacteraceae bacterium]